MICSFCGNVTENRRALSLYMRAARITYIDCPECGCALSMGEIRAAVRNYNEQFEEKRYNHNHDSKGRFCSGSGSGGSSEKSLDKSPESAYNDSDETSIPITKASINAVKKPEIFDDDEMNQNVQILCQRLLAETANDPPNTERAYSISLDNLKGNINEVTRSKGVDGDGTVTIQGLDVPFISIHNHPSGGTISAKDVHLFCGHQNEVITTVIGNNGKFYALEKTPDYSVKWIKFQLAIEHLNDDNIRDIVFERAEEYGLKYYEI